jgi:hypothetical protein
VKNVTGKSTVRSVELARLAIKTLAVLLQGMEYAYTLLFGGFRADHHSCSIALRKLWVLLAIRARCLKVYDPQKALKRAL